MDALKKYFIEKWIGLAITLVSIFVVSMLHLFGIFDGLEWDGDRPVKTKKMNLSLTWDHRVLDGAPAAEFLSEVTSLLSAPYRLLV